MNKEELVNKLRVQLRREGEAIKAFERLKGLGIFEGKEKKFWEGIGKNGKYSDRDKYILKEKMPDYAVILINNSIKNGLIKEDENGYRW